MAGRTPDPSTNVSATLTIEGPLAEVMSQLAHIDMSAATNVNIVPRGAGPPKTTGAHAPAPQSSDTARTVEAAAKMQYSADSGEGQSGPSEICRSWTNSGYCKYGYTCRFDHCGAGGGGSGEAPKPYFVEEWEQDQANMRMGNWPMWPSWPGMGGDMGWGDYGGWGGAGGAAPGVSAAHPPPRPWVPPIEKKKPRDRKEKKGKPQSAPPPPPPDTEPWTPSTTWVPPPPPGDGSAELEIIWCDEASFRTGAEERKLELAKFGTRVRCYKSADACIRSMRKKTSRKQRPRVFILVSARNAEFITFLKSDECLCQTMGVVVLRGGSNMPDESFASFAAVRKVCSTWEDAIAALAEVVAAT